MVMGDKGVFGSLYDSGVYMIGMVCYDEKAR